MAAILAIGDNDQHDLPQQQGSMSYTIVGVIGHIDHGKTSLVAALTGIDTDTHPEEKRRGITIDLGFAAFNHGDHQFALIDAPGHQKYIGNLLAGVSGIDVGLLVVACDQGIQAQTLEHAAILQSLGVEKLIVAISRIDLSDDATLAELREELEVFLGDYGFAEIPIVPVSSVSGAGIDALKEQLCSFARDSDRVAGSHFRLPIDRVFSVEGRGCVVAGTTWSGQVAVGDTVQIAGTDKTARVREIECHGEVIQHSRLGQRTAMNLAGVSANELTRGDELVTPGTHRTATRVLVDLQMFRETQPLRLSGDHAISHRHHVVCRADHRCAKLGTRPAHRGGRPDDAAHRGNVRAAMLVSTALPRRLIRWGTHCCHAAGDPSQQRPHGPAGRKTRQRLETRPVGRLGRLFG